MRVLSAERRSFLLDFLMKKSMPLCPCCAHRQPASAKWYDRRDYVFIEFCVEDSKDVNVNFEKSKLTFR